MAARTRQSCSVEVVVLSVCLSRAFCVAPSASTLHIRSADFNDVGNTNADCPPFTGKGSAEVTLRSDEVAEELSLLQSAQTVHRQQEVAQSHVPTTANGPAAGSPVGVPTAYERQRDVAGPSKTAVLSRALAASEAVALWQSADQVQSQGGPLPSRPMGQSDTSSATNVTDDSGMTVFSSDVAADASLEMPHGKGRDLHQGLTNSQDAVSELQDVEVSHAVEPAPAVEASASNFRVLTCFAIAIFVFADALFRHKSPKAYQSAAGSGEAMLRCAQAEAGKPSTKGSSKGLATTQTATPGCSGTQCKNEKTETQRQRSSEAKFTVAQGQELWRDGDDAGESSDEDCKEDRYDCLVEPVFDVSVEEPACEEGS